MNSEEAANSTAEDVSRRKLLSYLAGVLSCVMGLMLGIPLIGSFIAPLLNKKKPLWVKLGAPPKDISKPARYTFRYFRIDGWQEKAVSGTAYVVKDGESLRVLSNICTHLGCGVSWDEQKAMFVCPCHNGRFSVQGQVLGGPPPRPLDSYEHKLENGELHILVPGSQA